MIVLANQVEHTFYIICKPLLRQTIVAPGWLLTPSQGCLQPFHADAQAYK
jgi:hypothetical protein